MNDRVDLFAMKNFSDPAGVTQVGMMDGDLVANPGNVVMLDLGIVKVVEVVQNRDFMSFTQQLLDQMRANESSAAGNENLHSATVRRKRNPGKGRTSDGERSPRAKCKSTIRFAHTMK